MVSNIYLLKDNGEIEYLATYTQEPKEALQSYYMLYIVKDGNLVDNRKKYEKEVLPLPSKKGYYVCLPNGDIVNAIQQKG